MTLQADSTVVDSVVYGMTNVIQNDGGNIAFSGILVVFFGLVLIAFTIFLFSRSETEKKIEDAAPADEAKVKAEKKSSTAKSIPEDHLVAISTAVELYRRLHLEMLESRVTFERGETNPIWKTGIRFGQRKSLR